MQAGNQPSVAVVLSSFDPGGTEHQMLELIERLDRSRWNVHVVSMRARGPLLDRAASAAPMSSFLVNSFRRPELLRRLWSFARWCRERRIAIVHTTDQPSNIFGLAGASLAGVPVRIANRRYVGFGRTAMEIGGQRLAYAAAHRIVANSRAAAERLRLERVPDRKIVIIPNGVDPARFAGHRSGTTLRRVIAVGNLRPEKGHDVLIDAAPHVLRRYPDARFDIVGGGPLRPSLIERAAERRVAHAVTFLGQRDDVAAQLDAADLFVLPSRMEAFPNAVLEAMAAGLPVVASDAGGIPELVDDGRTGLLAPVGDPVALADRICQLIADPDAAARLGAAARLQVGNRYSFDRMVAAFEALYTTEAIRRGVLPAADNERKFLSCSAESLSQTSRRSPTRVVR